MIAVVVEEVEIAPVFIITWVVALLTFFLKPVF